ncbi:hypothetical protein TNCV_3135971 [Trichonephila clavipes]|nr:hypothetical protein TNCV_3135971 [Trichonephila clavipes]
MEIKGYSIAIVGTHALINDMMLLGMTDPNPPILVENANFLKRINGFYHQAVSEFTSQPPTPVKSQTVPSIHLLPSQLKITNKNPLPKLTSTKRKENTDDFTSPH